MNRKKPHRRVSFITAINEAFQQCRVSGDKRFIIHYGNLAGWPYEYAKGLREQGINAISVKPVDCDYTTPNGQRLQRELRTDCFVSLESDSAATRLYKAFFFLLLALRKAEAVHYHGGTILPLYIDAIVFKMLGIPTIISWGGNDARPYDEACLPNPYFYAKPDKKRDSQRKRKLKILGKLCVGVASDPEMNKYCERYFERTFVLRQPIDLSNLPPVPSSGYSSEPLVLHIPTDPTVKGTDIIESAVKALEERGLRFKYIGLVPNLTQAETRARIAECDIYVDELRCGSYGVTAVEAMAMAKVTVTYIREDLLNAYPKDLPLVVANPDTLTSVLHRLLVDTEFARDLASRSKLFVEKYHDKRVVVTDLIKIYRDIGVSSCCRTGALNSE